MSPVKLAAIVCTAALLAFVAAAALLGWWPIGPLGPHPMPVFVTSQTAAPESPGGEAQLKRAMTFTAPPEPTK